MNLGRNLMGLVLSIGAILQVKHSMDGIGTNALVKFTAFVDNVSGKISGTVFSRNKGGSYARGKGNPTNPQTSKQSAVRSRFAQIAQAWRGLSAEERAAWDASTDDYPYQNRLGDTKTLSGSGLHQKLNLNLSTIGLDNISAPLLPVALELPTKVDYAIDVLSSSIVVSPQFLAAPTGSTSFAVYATESSSAGRKNLKNRLRKIAIVTSDDLDGENLWASYVAVFGVPTVGANIALELRPVQTDTGQGSAPFYNVVKVTTN